MKPLPIPCFIEIEHPEKARYEEFCRTSNVKNPLPYPPLRVSFGLLRLPEIGDQLNLTTGEKTQRLRITNRIFLAMADEPSGGAIKLEGTVI